MGNEIICISVIVPIYNGSLLISRCIESIIAQKGIFNIEIIVIDDGSTDNSLKIVKEIVKLKKSERVTFQVITQENKGVAFSRNIGIRNAHGKYLAFLDVDDYWLDSFLIRTVSFLELASSAVAVSVGQIHKIFGNVEYICPSKDTNTTIINENGCMLTDFYQFWYKYNHVCTGSVLMRTEIALLTGGQRNDLKITEDLEFWAYLATYGYWGYIEEILFVSDGYRLTNKIGWLNKYQKRWSAAPTVEKWEQRIVHRFKQQLPEYYILLRGKIASNLIYSMILSDRVELALSTLKKYLKELPWSKLIIVLRVFSINKILWGIICFILKKREYNRRISY